MPKKSTAKKKVQKSGAVSFKTVPATSAEKNELAKIIDNKKYWQRDKMKKEFVEKYNRIPKEVDLLVKGADRVVKLGEDIQEVSKRAPRGRINEPVFGTEMRIDIKSLRIEGKTLIIEL